MGELVQIDGCEHRWFEDRAPACTALVHVDDPTSALNVVSFTNTESMFACFEATRQYLKLYDEPLAYYSDKPSICRVNPLAVAAAPQTRLAGCFYAVTIDAFCANTAAATWHPKRARPLLLRPAR